MKSSLKIRTIIIDDEEHWQVVIQKYARKIPELILENIFSDVESAYNFLLNNDVDLIFLDVKINDENGIDLIKSLNAAFSVIIISSHKSFALDGYSISAVDYLTKPINYDKFEKAVQKAIQQFQLRETALNNRKVAAFDENYFLIKEEEGLVKIPYIDVFYITAYENYIKIVTTNKIHVVLTTLSHFERSFNNHPFVRIHRSHIINLNHIKIFNKDSCILINDIEIPISGTYRNDIHEIFAEGKLVNR
jgi:two-component system, LytTR family, response regulator